MKEELRFKPLWRIHNRTYRHYARGSFYRRMRRYLGKLKAMLKMMLKAARRRLRG